MVPRFFILRKALRFDKSSPHDEEKSVQQTFENKTVLITGATRGLGQQLALSLAKQGAHIIALGRTVGALEDLDDQIKSLGGQCTLTPLDLIDIETIDALGPTLFPRFNKLDFFIANAAYLGALSPVTHTNTQEWSKILTTNLTANFALIRTLAPLLRQAETATALFITDNNEDNRSAAYWGPYSASKAALESLVSSYAKEIHETNVKAITINPAPMGTALRRKAYPGEDQSTLTNTTTTAQHIIEKLLENNYANGDQLTV